MEDQGKRLLLAVGIVLAIMLGWSYLFPQKPPTKDKGTDTSAVVAPVVPAPAGTPGIAPTAAASPAPAISRGTEKVVELTFPSFSATFSTYGGALKSWKLLGEQFYHGARGVPEDLVHGEDERLWPFEVSFPTSTLSLPSKTEWKLVEQTAERVAFEIEAGGLRVKKTFTVHPEHYLVELAVDVAVASGTAKQNLMISLGSFQDPATIKKGGFRTGIGREWMAACLANGTLSQWGSKDLAATSKEVGGQVNWFGFVYPYFMTAVAIEPRDERVTCRASGPDAQAGPMVVEAQFLPVDLSAGATYQRRVAGYFGPRYMGQLEAIGTVLGWKDVGFEKAINLGWLGFLAGPLLALLNFFHGLVGNWPLSIVLLTLTVKLATLYWTHKSMKSMKAMSKLRPELEKLKEKYKDDRQRQQVETMNLFKEHGVNPMAGCLPMLLQMPIWFALYRALSVAAELYHAPFLWISDLTANDPLFILPVFMTAMMLVQSLLQPATASGAQQKMLSYGMPLLFGGMSLFFPAGLTLYISTNSILTLLHHLYMRAEEKRAAGGPARSPGGEAKDGARRVIDVVDQTAEPEPEDGEPEAGGPATNGSSGGGKKKSKRRGAKRRGAHS